MSENEVTLDFDRINRTGLAEAVFCNNKSTEQLQTICQTIIDEDKAMLFTRLEADLYEGIGQRYGSMLEYDPVSRTAFCKPAALKYDTPLIAVVTGGSSDTPVAREAVRSLRFYGHPTLNINDAGVAGLWRITERLEVLRSMKIVICIAGMDAALPTVLGGLIPSFIIAVPTSIGYGVARNGETALNALLCSCAPGLVVVNIDNGYGAACAALRAMNNLS